MFQFKLEKVLGVRKQLEEQATIALAEAKRKYATMAEMLECLKKTYTIHIDRFTQKPTLDEAEVWLFRMYKQGLENDIAETTVNLQALAKKVAVCRKEVIHRSKERKLLDKLKTKQYIQYQQEALHKEQKVLDEIVTIRYQAGN